ncbi:YheC/YheD family protein [Paenibacillus aurantius]|uniref:YheC/YheD family protein n=1 Tax=Paenibacillus aurantius TaxID=2918900 RepID=A0AA96LFU0_9BACL|nr:YheC/YheD family protein [Paenibacillus aurantius]WNQ12510.1 YheC/YheD family protein [Paenibacillus aurantius]
MLSRYVASKWRKTEALLPDPAIRDYIPATVKMTRSSLHDMLVRYGTVYVKPDSGLQGKGVMRVERREGRRHKYKYQAGEKIYHFRVYGELYDALRKVIKGRKYLAQKGIPMLTYNKRPFDLRVMVQTNLDQKWETTGIIGRVAHPKRIVTNYHSGGQLKPVEKLLTPYLSPSRKKEQIRELEELGVRVGRRMGSRFPGVKEVGLDVALDGKVRPWILEVNTRPDPYIFRTLKDKEIFRRIYRYAKAYKRL